MKNVLTKHLVEINIKSAEDDKGIGGEAFNKAYEVLYEVKDLPMYNSAVTLFAPNGTTGLCLGCDTTSIEPCLALVSFKELVGGGYMKIVNNSVKRALENLGYIKEDVEKILNYISKNNTIEGSILRDEHLSIFDCALESYKGSRVIHYNGHIDMMAALQPFISMAISKTINAPEDITINEIFDIYVDSWKKGLKSITIYRDGSKKTQPLKTAKKEKAKEVKKEAIKKSLPDERSSITHKFNIAGHEGYLTVGLYEDGTPGELFVKMSKEGSVISGLMDSLAKSISLAIQHGVPLESLIDKFVGTKFDPSGVTINKDIPIAKSIVDYIFTWLDQKFVNKKACVPCSKKVELVPITDKKEDAGACQVCGGLLQWSGHCKVCASCGTSTGCS
jgi:ribonucleoside-diphosphate reductase alpha chain